MAKTDPKSVYVVSDNIVSSLGFTTSDNIRNICCGKTGIGYVQAGPYASRMLPLALVDTMGLDERSENLSIPRHFTRLEKMMLFSVDNAIRNSGLDITDRRTVFVISTTKGNIEGLSTHCPTNCQPVLWPLGERIRCYYKNPNQAIVISNACVSGILAVEIAARMLRNNLYDHAVVIGGDLVSRFVVSGFDSFQALSKQPCRPYDANRDGLTLGEGCATIVLSCSPPSSSGHELIRILGGASSNDATHISAPDRTGTGLSRAISRTLAYSGIQASDVDAICAHGTATIYNDEMESQAMGLVNLSDTPIYSLKGYWGHTLGAAGLMETVAVVQSLRQQYLFGTLGFESCGTSGKLRVVDKTEHAQLRHVLKTASGFGGCNAALIVSKTNS